MLFDPSDTELGGKPQRLWKYVELCGKCRESIYMTC